MPNLEDAVDRILGNLDRWASHVETEEEKTVYIKDEKQKKIKRSIICKNKH